MIVWQHDRTDDHEGTEDCYSVLITSAIGRYPADTYLCDMLDDMFERLALIDADYVHGFEVLGLDAFIAPYDPQGLLSGFFGLDSVIEEEAADTFGLDAEIAAPVTVETFGEFGLGSFFVELHNDAITVLTQEVDPGDTVIHVSSSVGFPSVPFLIQIGTEQMTVVSMSGNDWTVERTDAQSHPLGSYVVVC
jgi:hypothetical protein